jgi:hypothetical protein
MTGKTVQGPSLAFTFSAVSKHLRLKNLHYAPLDPKRDPRLDMFRGFALLTIFINHIPGTVFENFTHRNIGFSDAAEAFVLLSGMATALAYSDKIQKNIFNAIGKMIKRAVTLYIIHIITMLCALAMIFAAIRYWNAETLIDSINTHVAEQDPQGAFIGLFSLGWQIGYFNILPMYAVLLLGLPIMLKGAIHKPGVTFALSIVLWICAWVWQINMPNYPQPGGWFFNPFSWQIIFLAGIIAGLAMKGGKQIPFNPVLFWLCIAYLIFAATWVLVPLWGLEHNRGLPSLMVTFDKTYVGLPRLLHILALAYVLSQLSIVAKLASAGIMTPIRSLGRHSLPVFAFGSLLSITGIIIKTQIPNHIALDALLLSTGIALHCILALLLDKPWKNSVSQNRIIASD